MLQVNFPNKLYLTIEHSVGAEGRFEFEFWYTDQDAQVLGDQTAEQASDDDDNGYSLIQLTEVQDKDEANLTYVYVCGVVGFLIITSIVVIVIYRVRKQRKLSIEVKSERERGIMPKWVDAKTKVEATAQKFVTTTIVQNEDNLLHENESPQSLRNDSHLRQPRP